jgi:predicted Zn finger-like uncharacterized protein
MSLITRCPACGTMFKVVPDQLRISEGWVRCGHCAEVFDAAAHLQRPQAQQAPASATPASAPAEPAAFDQELEPEPEPAFEAAPTLASQAEADSAGDPWQPAGARPDSALEPPVQLGQADAGYPPFELVRAHQDDPPPPSGFGTVTSTSAEPTDFPEEGDDSQLQDLGFVRKARRAALWRRPAVRALLVLLLLALAGLLAVQWAVHERDRLAALRPELRPLLVAACEPLACEVAAVRQIESIVIDSSSFNRLRSDAYRLSFTLKNQGGFEVALPAMELTLTDSQDQPVVRRVLLPPELGGATRVIAAGADWSTTLALNVAANGSAGRIAGYRLLAFYP